MDSMDMSSSAVPQSFQHPWRRGVVPLICAISFSWGCGPGTDPGEAGAASESAVPSGAGPAPTSAPASPASPGGLVPVGFTNLGDEPVASAGSAFWDHWGDGRAEMSSYHVTLSRYGEPREGELVLIYVTEPHDRRTWIKDDAAVAPDRIEVMKLNASLEFMTGIYPYSVMTSVFSPVDDWGMERFQPTKIGLSVQEWCGNYLHQLWPGRGRLRSLMVSYFPQDGEELADREIPAGTLYEDGLLIQLRELDSEFASGGSWSGPLMPSLWNVRRGIAPARPVAATIERAEGVDEEGRAVTRFEVRYEDFRITYVVERDAPRRMLGWTTSVGDTVRMVESIRLDYWNANDGSGSRFREALGLDPDASGRPPVAP